MESKTLPTSRIAMYRVAVGVLFSLAGGTVRADLGATIRLPTGELRITNAGVADFSMVGYTISFPTSELRSDDWLPVAGRLDATGDMSFDPTNAWIIIAPPTPLPATADELTEGVVMGDGGVLAPGESLYLGPVWDSATVMSVTIMVADESSALVDVPVSYLPAGDYNEDGLVDGLDYTLWKDTFGSTGIGLLADGNADQTVNLADYSVWRDNLGATGVPAIALSTAIASSNYVPEPTSVATIVALSLLYFSHRRLATFRRD